MSTRLKETLIVILLAAVGFVGIYTLLASASAQKEPATIAKPNGPGPQRPILDLSGFNPGNLISDAEFFNADAMSEEQVRTFIKDWNDGCESDKEKAPCLSEYREHVPFRQATRFCPYDMPGGDLDAAGIISQAAYACQISPQVLLVTLQKEQGLISASGSQLKEERYSIALGYGCPDGEACDQQFFGFANQIYGAAQQFQRYRVEPWKYQVKAGQNNAIQFHVNPECGSKTIYIENQATAGLYNYTPYQPTADTLAGHRTQCSTWGNMNFYGLYQAWFK
ncbi:hypothetical protein HMPREF0044_0171 [Gleimia coleocanis DSM 15436]|uniref:Hemagglutinin n=1 Tax=Gleimia coleocanis DSM 15436 TaxID=525245 RepID=C0VYD1_9ACTO|nr:hypothetical protein [Gleimia coleocanis]EEH64434.1 hypothetical protein HMPREF0044_0171 [Gleimia coleocanis DSM 15436]